MIQHVDEARRGFALCERLMQNLEEKADLTEFKDALNTLEKGITRMENEVAILRARVEYAEGNETLQQLERERDLYFGILSSVQDIMKDGAKKIDKALEAANPQSKSSAGNEGQIDGELVNVPCEPFSPEQSKVQASPEQPQAEPEQSKSEVSHEQPQIEPALEQPTVIESKTSKGTRKS